MLITARKNLVRPTNPVCCQTVALLVSLLWSAVHSAFLDQMYEIQPTAPIEVPRGWIVYHPTIKVANTNTPGTFSFLENAQTATSATAMLKFFDSAPISDFVHAGDLKMTLNPVGSKLLKQNLYYYGPLWAIMCNTQIDNDGDGISFLKFNQASKPFTEDSKAAGPGVRSEVFLQSLSSPQNEWRQVFSTSSTTIVVSRYFNVKQEYQAKITHPEGKPPVFVDDLVNIGDWTFYIDRSGKVYKDDAKNFYDGLVVADTTNTVTGTIQIPSFYPLYSKLDQSEECVLANCHVLVVESNENPAQSFLAMLLLQAEAADFAKLKFPHLDVTSLGLLSAPIQPTALKRYVVLGGNTFYSFKILSDRIEQDTAFQGPTITGYLPGSLTAGQFEQAKYAGVAPGMVLVSNGATYLAKMFIFDTSGCKSRAATGECAVLCTVETCSPPVAAIPTPKVTPRLWPVVRIRREMLRNRIRLLFQRALRSRPVYTIKVVDLDHNKEYTCAQVGCHMTWRDAVLETTFDTSVQVTRGLLVFTKTQTTRLLSDEMPNRRTLEEEEYEVITVENFQLIKEGWFFSWITVAQLVVFAFRTLGSLVLFGRHPVVAMSMDVLITQCVLLGLYLGPFLTSSELVLQVVGQVKVIWYWYPNPFFGWDHSDLSCAPRPNHGAHGVVCSFFDNYGQNVIGFAAFGLLLTLLHHAARYVRTRSSGRVNAACAIVEQHYGVQYWIAKLDANQLEVMLYVLVSYSLADSSSKSVVGLVLATTLMIFYAVVAVGKHLLLTRYLNGSAAPATTPVTQTPTVGGPASETVRLPDPKRETSSGAKPLSVVSSPSTSTWTDWCAECLAYTRRGTATVAHRSQTFGPVAKLLRTFAVCILLLNHTSSAVAQLVIGTVLEALYLGSLFLTRTEEKWFDFYSIVGVQSAVSIFLALRAVSTDGGIPVANNQGGMAVILSLTVLCMFATVGVCMICAFVSLWFASDAADKKYESPKPDAAQQPQKAISHKLTLIEDELDLPAPSVPPAPVAPPEPAILNPVSREPYNFYELEVAQEYIDRVEPHPEFQALNGQKAPERDRGTGLQQQQKQSQIRTPQYAATRTGV